MKHLKDIEQRLPGFWKDGYLAPVDLLSAEEVAEGTRAYVDCLERMQRDNSLTFTHKSEDDSGNETKVHQIRAAHLQHPFFDRLIRDERILDIAEAIIGPNIRLTLCQGLYKAPGTGGEIQWHQDDYYFRASKENAVVSCWLTFDDATVDNGCMWLLQGSHGEFQEHVRPVENKPAIIPQVDDSKAVPIELRAGQALFHHGSAAHRTLPNTTDTHRRAIAMHYMDSTAHLSGQWGHDEPPENMPLLRGVAA